MNNDEKINLIGQKILLLSANLDKYKQELDNLKFQLSVLQPEKNISVTPEIKTEPVIEASINEDTIHIYRKKWDAAECLICSIMLLIILVKKINNRE